MATKVRAQLAEQENTTIKLLVWLIAKCVELENTTIKQQRLSARAVESGNTTIKRKADRRLLVQVVKLVSFKMYKVRILASRTAFAPVVSHVRTRLMLTQIRRIVFL